MVAATRRGVLPRALATAVSLLLTASAAVLVSSDAGTPLVGRARAAEAGPLALGDLPGVAVPTTLPVPLPASPAAAIPELPPPASDLPLPALAAPTKAVPAGIDAFRGLGTWVDVYDWSRAYTNGSPRVSPGDVEAMAAAGVQTLYIQASKHDAGGDVLEPELLAAWLRAAHARGLSTVAWYLPTLVDTGRDRRRLEAIAALEDVDAVGVDIEARDVGDVAERNRRLVELSAAVRRALPGRTLAAIVLPPVVLEVVNTSYWPAFPYRDIASSYDVWMPMSYWTNRKAGSEYREAYRYTKENVARLRANVGRPDLPVHPIGGIGDASTGADGEGYRRAATEVGAIGGSIYDWRTTRAELWGPLRALRR